MGPENSDVVTAAMCHMHARQQYRHLQHESHLIMPVCYHLICNHCEAAASEDTSQIV